MVEQARRRNRAAIEVGLVELKLGGLELLPRFGEAFDKVFSVNVPLFLSDPAPISVEARRFAGHKASTTACRRHGRGRAGVWRLAIEHNERDRVPGGLGRANRAQTGSGSMRHGPQIGSGPPVEGAACRSHAADRADCTGGACCK